LPSSAMTCKRDTASTLPTTSFTNFGLYFSTCHSVGNMLNRRGLPQKMRRCFARFENEACAVSRCHGSPRAGHNPLLMSPALAAGP
jgi:hypothetical protein